MTMIGEISVIMPAYNEAGNMEGAVEDILRQLPSLAAKFEMIIVDDGSTDKTVSVAEALCRAHPAVRLLCHDRNRGKGAALETGFQNAKMEWLLMIDADRQISPQVLPEFLRWTGEYDMIIGYRTNRGESAYRRFSSKVYAKIIGLTLGLGVKDLNCPMKLFRKTLLGSEPLQSQGFLIDAEILKRAADAGGKVKEIGVTPRLRQSGSSTVKIRHSLDTLRELRALMRRLRKGR